jgi:alpha-tubulin suppressor-like RCC1 family protein
MSHVVAISADHEVAAQSMCSGVSLWASRISAVSVQVFGWGSTQNGRLGPHKEEVLCLPTPLEIPEDVTVTQAVCGSDATIFITSTGTMLACGSNKCGKAC